MGCFVRCFFSVLFVCGSAPFVLCFRSAVDGLFCVVLFWFERSLSFQDVTQKGLVHRRSMLVVAVVDFVI